MKMIYVVILELSSWFWGLLFKWKNNEPHSRKYSIVFCTEASLKGSSGLIAKMKHRRALPRISQVFDLLVVIFEILTGKYLVRK